MDNILVNRYFSRYSLTEQSQKIHCPLPANMLNILPFINISNKSNYELAIYVNNPANVKELPFLVIKPMELLSFVLPETLTTEGVYIETLLINNTPIKTNHLSVIFSDVSFGWCSTAQTIETPKIVQTFKTVSIIVPPVAAMEFVELSSVVNATEGYFIKSITERSFNLIDKPLYKYIKVDNLYLEYLTVNNQEQYTTRDTWGIDIYRPSVNISISAGSQYGSEVEQSCKIDLIVNEIEI